jgi:hypothetical protein
MKAPVSNLPLDSSDCASNPRARRAQGVGVRLNDPCATVRAWFDAFNSRSVDRALACMSTDVEFHPVRARRSYRGHQGVTEWLATITRRFGPIDPVRIDRVDPLPDGRVLAIGCLVGAPFAAIHDLDDSERISAAHHYMSDETMLEHLGMITSWPGQAHDELSEVNA